MDLISAAVCPHFISVLLFAAAVRQTPCPRTTCPWLGTVPVLTGIREKRRLLLILTHDSVWIVMTHGNSSQSGSSARRNERNVMSVIDIAASRQTLFCCTMCFSFFPYFGSHMSPRPNDPHPLQSKWSLVETSSFIQQLGDRDT